MDATYMIYDNRKEEEGWIRYESDATTPTSLAEAFKADYESLFLMEDAEDGRKYGLKISEDELTKTCIENMKSKTAIAYLYEHGFEIRKVEKDEASRLRDYFRSYRDMARYPTRFPDRKSRLVVTDDMKPMLKQELTDYVFDHARIRQRV